MLIGVSLKSTYLRSDDFWRHEYPYMKLTQKSPAIGLYSFSEE